jgi:hypothetical protein
MATIIGCGSGVIRSASDALQISPNIIDFGAVNIGETKRTSVAISNVSPDAVSISQLSVSGQTFSVFGSDALPINIPPGGTYTFAVGFAPVASINYSGKITMLDANSRSIAQLQMEGAGSNVGILAVSAANVIFGNVPVNTPATQSLTLTSTGTSPVTVNSAALTGSGFTIVTQKFPVTLNPAQSLTLQVQFNPVATGAARGQLIINSDSSTGTTALVALSGTGIAAQTPRLAMSAAALNFGKLVLNSSATQSLTLISTGTSPVTVNSVTITGAGFTLVTPGLPVILNSSQSFTLQVQFSPVATGAASGQLTINSDSFPEGTAVVALSGVGNAMAAHNVTLSWDAPTDSKDPVAGYNIYRATDSGPFVVINPSPDLTVTYVDNTVVSGTSYTYEVTSVGSSGTESDPSNQVTLVIP